ncbi:hypothetical protein ACLB1Q_06515 [Escherichia coli]
MAVESDANGDFSYGWLTTLIQTLKLGLESFMRMRWQFQCSSASCSRFTGLRCEHGSATVCRVFCIAGNFQQWGDLTYNIVDVGVF